MWCKGSATIGCKTTERNLKLPTKLTKEDDEFAKITSTLNWKVNNQREAEKKDKDECEVEEKIFVQANRDSHEFQFTLK